MEDYESFTSYGNLSANQTAHAGGVGSSVFGKGVRSGSKNGVQQHPQQQVQQPQAQGGNPFGKGKFLIDFYGSWCGPCQKMAPHFEALEKQIPGVTFVKVEIGEEQDLAMSMGVQSVPTFVAIKNGKEVDRMVGADPNKLKALAGKLVQM